MPQRSTHLPIVIDIPEPCPESWSNMVGSDRERRCDRCEKQIHNLSELSRAEIAELVTRENVCITLEVKPNGELVTAEPRAHDKRSGVRKVVLAAALSALAACNTEPTVGTMKTPFEPTASAVAVSAPSGEAMVATPSAAVPPSTSATATSTDQVKPPVRIGGTIPPVTRTMGAPSQRSRKIGKLERTDS